MDGGRHLRAALGAAGEPPRAREWFGWLGLGLLLAIVATWPLLLHLPDHVPQDLGDPLGQAWALAWGGHALKTDPLHFFEANTFWPTGPSLAYSDSLLGYAPFGLVGEGVTAAVVRYNVVFLLAYAASFAGAALLARELGCSRGAAALAGVAFAFAPWRASHNGHLNVLSAGAIPLALALLAGGYRRRRPRRILAGWAGATWQMTLGFALGIYFFYLLAALAAAAAVTWLWRGRPPLTRPVVLATAAGVLLLGATTAAVARPYLDVLDRYPEAARERIEVEFYSPPPSALLVAPAENRLWGGPTKAARETIPWAPEQALFPGVTVLLLAAVGVLSRHVVRPLRVGLGLAAIVATLLSFGLRLKDGRWTYAPLYDHLPGFEGLRTPGRLTVLTSLALGLLAAFGADRIARRAARTAPQENTGRYRQSAALPPGARAFAATAGLALLVLTEGLPKLPLAEVPRPPDVRVKADPQLHLPAAPLADTVYMLWSVEDGFPRMGNGYSGVAPDVLERLKAEVTGFPDRRSVEALRSLGYRTVVLHTDRVAGTPWADAVRKPVDGLGITSGEYETVVVYDLSPPTPPG